MDGIPKAAAAPAATAGGDGAPARARRSRSLASAAATLAFWSLCLLAAVLAVLALAPGLADGLLPAGGAEIVRLFFGSFLTGLLTAGVFLVAAVFGGASFVRAGRALGQEELALGQARAAIRRGPAVLANRSASGSAFFAAGSDAMAGLSRTATHAMAENIAKDAGTFRYEPVAMIVDRVAPQVLSGSLNLRDAQQFGIRLGILGTFFGMTLALGRISGVFDASGDAAASQDAVAGVIDSLSLGFGTSIAGLLAAIVLQVMAWGLRARETGVLDGLQETATGMQALFRLAEIGAGSLGASLDEVKVSAGELQRGLARHGTQVSEGGERLEAAVRSAAGAFAEPLAEIRRTGDRLATLLSDQSGAVAGLGEATRAVSALQASAAGHFDAAMARAAEVQRHAAEALRAEIRAMAGGIAEEMRAGFEANRGRQAPDGAPADLARAAGLMEAAFAAQARAARRLSVLVGAAVLVLLVVAGLLAWPLLAPDAAPPVAAEQGAPP